MYNKKLLAKAFLSVVLAITLAFPSVSPVLGVNTVVRAEAAEKVGSGILKEAFVKINALGFGQYLSIVLEDGVDFNRCSFAVDGIPIHPTKVSDTGSVSKWEIVHLNHKNLTVDYNGKEQTVMFNAGGTGEAFVEKTNKVMPKWVWGSGAINVFDFHSSSYDAMGNKLEMPAKTTFDVLNSTVEAEEKIAYYVKEAILEDAFNGGPEVEIKFALSGDRAKEWFRNISYVARMAESSQSKGLDDKLIYETKTVDYQGRTNGILTLKSGQMALRREGINYIRIISGSEAVSIPVEIVSAKAPKLTFTGSITNPRVGESFKFKVEGSNQGLLSQNDFIRKATLKRPLTDGNKEQESIELKFGEIGLIGDLLVVDGKVLTKSGWYELEIGFRGYKTVTQKFKIQPTKKTKNSKPSTSDGNTSSNENVGGGTSSSAGGSSSGGSVSGGTSSSAGGFGGASAGTGTAGSSQTAPATNSEKKSEIIVDEEETPLSYAPVKAAKVEIVKKASEASMKKAIRKDVKKVFGDVQNIRHKDLLIYIYKADSKKNQKLAKKLSDANLDKKVKKFIIKLNLISKKELTAQGLKKVLSKKEVEGILDKYVATKKYGKVVRGRATKIHALGGATGKSIGIGKNKPGGSSGSGSIGGTIKMPGEFLFDYDMLINALILSEQNIGNVYSDRITKMFMEELTQPRAIFTDANNLYDFGTFRTKVSDAESEGRYLDYDAYIKEAVNDDKLKSSAYQLTVVLDTGALGKHFYRGLSGNPDQFGGKLPQIGRVSVKRGEALEIDLKDEAYVAKIYPYNPFMVNTSRRAQTDQYGIKMRGTVLTMPADQVLRAIKNAKPDATGKNSFYIEIEARGYEQIHIDVDVYADKLPNNPGQSTPSPSQPTPSPSQPTPSPSNPVQPEQGTPGNHQLPEISGELSKVMGLLNTYQLQLTGNTGADAAYMKAITSVKAIPSSFKPEGYVLDKVSFITGNNQFTVGETDGYIKMQLHQVIVNDSVVVLRVEANGYPTTEYKVDLRKAQQKADISLKDTGNTGSADTGNSSVSKTLPEFNLRLEKLASYNNRYQLNLTSAMGDGVGYINAIKFVKADTKMMEKKAFVLGVNQFSYGATDGYLSLQFDQATVEKKVVPLLIVAEGYPTVALSLDLERERASVTSLNAQTPQGETPSMPKLDFAPVLTTNSSFGMTKYKLQLDAAQNGSLESFIRYITSVKANGAELEKSSFIMNANQYNTNFTDGYIEFTFGGSGLVTLEVETKNYAPVTFELDLSKGTVNVR